MPDWRSPEAYAFDPPLTREEWAWQFLRRNPDYRRDQAWFIATWRALEAAYGAPPERDFFRWKQDPRAWRAEVELPGAEINGCGADFCPGENDQVLIECWMGARWGLRKFPLDPDIDRPAEVPAWREQPVQVREAQAADLLSCGPETIALLFDLSLPLAAQLADARIRLVARQRALEKAGQPPYRMIRAAASQWTGWLRLLDGVAAGIDADELGRVLGLDDPAAELENARRMTISGYRRILLMD